jgi:ribosome-binding factor A
LKFDSGTFNKKNQLFFITFETKSLQHIMATIRQNKISRLLQKELGEIFQRESRNLFGGSLITVTVVRVSPDLSVAKVYLSVFSPAGLQNILDLIEEQKKNIRHQLSQRIKNQMKFMPDLVFIKDDSLDYIERIENLLKS